MYSNLVVKKIGDSELELTAEIGAESFETFRPQALKHLASSLELPGFRKGHVPQAILEERLGARVLEEMAGLALSSVYPKIIEAEKIDAIDRPRIQITKLARGNPLAFRIKQTVLPEIALPDYKKLAANVPADTDREKSPQTSGVDREQRWIKIAESLLASTEVPAPDILIERQIEQFLAHTKNEGPEARAAIRPEASKYVRLQLLLAAIGKKENLPLPAVVEMLEKVGA